MNGLDSASKAELRQLQARFLPDGEKMDRWRHLVSIGGFTGVSHWNGSTWTETTLRRSGGGSGDAVAALAGSATSKRLHGAWAQFALPTRINPKAKFGI